MLRNRRRKVGIEITYIQPKMFVDPGGDKDALLYNAESPEVECHSYSTTQFVTKCNRFPYITCANFR